MPRGSWGSSGDGSSSKNVKVCVLDECVCVRIKRSRLRCSNIKWPFAMFNRIERCSRQWCALSYCVRTKKPKRNRLSVQNGDSKLVWPEFRTMCYLLQIQTDMIGLVVIITWELLVLFSLNHCNGKQELFQRTVGAVLLLDSISVSLWLLDNSIFWKQGGKMCNANSPWNFTTWNLLACHTTATRVFDFAQL